MKILVTGRHGQLVQSLLERGGGGAGFTLISVGRPELDLEEPGSIADTIRSHAPDVIINAAAHTSVDQAEDEPALAMRINGAAAGELAAAAGRIGARIVQISTDYVFDGAAKDAYVEDAPTNPLGAYGRSKLEGEIRVRQENPDHVIVRTAWVYSPFGRNFLKTMMGLARDHQELSVVDDQRGNPSSALDLADGLLAILDSWKSEPRRGLGHTYHLAGTGVATWLEFAQQVFAECERVGAPSASVRAVPSAEWPTKAPRPMNSALDCAKFARDFGYPAPPWKMSAAATVRRVVESGHRR